jgi:GntR family transcriptional regulator
MTLAFVPHYRRIEQVLRERIATLKPGDELPSDADLCAEFGVSRMTARNAMQRLAEEGIVVRQPGRGSFVAQPPVHRRANRLMTFSSEMERLGRRPSSRLLRREIRSATAIEATDLGLVEGDAVVSLRRVRCADGEPMALESAVLGGRVADAVMSADVTNGSLHAALAAAGHTLRRGTATIRAAPASPEDAALLGVNPGEPLLVERRVILDGHGRPLEATESRYAGERYALDVWFDVEPSRAPDGG